MTDPMQDTPPCSSHPDAPHGFNRNESHNLDRYVCDCEGWTLPGQGIDHLCACPANRTPVAYRWRFLAGADRTWRHCATMPGFDPAIVESEPLFL